MKTHQVERGQAPSGTRRQVGNVLHTKWNGPSTPNLIFLSFRHSNGATMRFEPEKSDGANNGLHIVRDMLHMVQKECPHVSEADLTARWENVLHTKWNLALPTKWKLSLWRVPFGVFWCLLVS